MTREEVEQEFRDAGALLEGHFILSSGRHSDRYFNKSKLGMHPNRVARMCEALAKNVQASGVTPPSCVVSPVLGAIVFGFETAKQLGVPFMFAERAAEGGFALRRGFELEANAPVLVVEDIVSTGLSAGEAVECVRAAGGDPVAVGCLVDRSDGAADVGAPLIPLLSIKVQDYAPDALPPHLANVPAVKPGSRAGVTT